MHRPVLLPRSSARGLALPSKDAKSPISLAPTRRAHVILAASSAPRQLTSQLQRCVTQAELKRLLSSASPSSLNAISVSAALGQLAKLPQAEPDILEQLLKLLRPKLPDFKARRAAHHTAPRPRQIWCRTR